MEHFDSFFISQLGLELLKSIYGYISKRGFFNNVQNFEDILYCLCHLFLNNDIKYIHGTPWTSEYKS